MTQDQAIDELKKFKELLDLNAITQEEYDTKKAELMPLLMAKKPATETAMTTSATQPSTKPAAEKKEESSSSGCLVMGIIAVVLILFLVIIASAGSGSSSSSGSSKAKTETYSLHDVKIISQSDFEERIKKVLRDPDSYQRIDYDLKYVSGDEYKATLKFRARNGFGGMNVSTYEGDLIWKSGSGSYSLGHIHEVE